jgi:hypothetical protein
MDSVVRLIGRLHVSGGREDMDFSPTGQHGNLSFLPSFTGLEKLASPPGFRGRQASTF